MTKPIEETTREILMRESARRREQTVRQLEALTQKYKPGGNWQLLQPGPHWEAAELWIAELKDVGKSAVEELLKSGAPQSAGPEGIEKSKRVIYDWINHERDGYLLTGLKNFLEARGTLVDQEFNLLRAQVSTELAQATKEILIQLSRSVSSAK